MVQPQQNLYDTKSFHDKLSGPVVSICINRGKNGEYSEQGPVGCEVTDASNELSSCVKIHLSDKWNTHQRLP